MFDGEGAELGSSGVTLSTFPSEFSSGYHKIYLYFCLSALQNGSRAPMKRCAAGRGTPRFSTWLFIVAWELSRNFCTRWVLVHGHHESLKSLRKVRICQVVRRAEFSHGDMQLMPMTRYCNAVWQVSTKREDRNHPDDNSLSHKKELRVQTRLPIRCVIPETEGGHFWRDGRNGFLGAVVWSGSSRTGRQVGGHEKINIMCEVEETAKGKARPRSIIRLKHEFAEWGCERWKLEDDCASSSAPA